jgi:CDP-glucose 4,6-dehydratase
MGFGRAAMEDLDMIDRAFWRNKRVLLTGHTGFKGAWLSLWLEQLGADVFGFALPPDTDPSMYSMLGLLARQISRLGDIRDPRMVAEAVREARPQIVVHMAAQPLVRRSYREPVETYGTNVMGTAHLLDALRHLEGLKAILVITTDKVYKNGNGRHTFCENDPLGAHDPYAASKVATEFVVASFAASFFAPSGVPIATARAGNVIGGGDWAEDRLIPDVWRAVQSGEPLRLRNPQSTRPWQHVLEPLSGYLAYIERLASGEQVPGALNFGPLPGQALTVAEVADAMLAAMRCPHGWVAAQADEPQPEEAQFLALDPGLAETSIDWRPRLAPAEALQWTAEWYQAVSKGADARTLSTAQLRRYEALA